MSDANPETTRKLGGNLWLTPLALLIVISLIGVKLALPMYREHQAIIAIEQAGGHITTFPRSPEWLWEKTGADWETARVAAFLNREVGEEMQIHLQSLPNLLSVLYDETRITETSLNRMKERLPNCDFTPLGSMLQCGNGARESDD